MATDQPVRQQQDADPLAARRLQILSTEHFSLLTTRSLTYTESFSRVGMFFSVLSGAVIALALVAQAGRYGETFVVTAILVLSVVIFVGIATVARLLTVNGEDIRWIAGMNRLRHAYLEMHPELEKYFIVSSNDDARGISMTMGVPLLPIAQPIARLTRAFQTLPAMVAVMVAAVAGALSALVCTAAGVYQLVAVGLGAATFLAVYGLFALYMWRSITHYMNAVPPNFPSSQTSL